MNTDHQNSGGHRRRVVLVDDDPAVRSAIAFALEAEGYWVQSFADGEAVLAHQPAADCYIIDDRLGDGMTGLDLLHELRTNGRSAPAVIITTQPTRAVALRSRELQVPIVEKPLIGPTFVSVIEALLD